MRKKPILIRKAKKIKKTWLKIPETVRIALVVFSFAFPSWIILAILIRKYLSIFGEGLLIEFFGMVLDILVIGIIILWWNENREKKRHIQRWQDEIDDFRGWESEEAMFRIVGNIKRLNKKGINKINLNRCYLKKAQLHKNQLQESNLEYIKLQNAILSSVNLKGAYLKSAYLTNAILIDNNFEEAFLKKSNFEGATSTQCNFNNAIFRSAHFTNFRCVLTSFKKADFLWAYLKNASFFSADFKEACFRKATLEGASFFNCNFESVDFSYSDLRHIKNLAIEQLSTVKTLYKASLDPNLKKKIKKSYPHLLEEPGMKLKNEAK